MRSAAGIADAEGLDAVTIARVAKDVGVQAPSLYNHVESREALVREVGLLGTRELGAAMSAAAVGRAGADALTAMAHAARAYARDHPGRYAAGVAAPGPDEAERAAAAAPITESMIAVMRGWVHEGDSPVHSVRAIRAAVHGFIALEAAGGFGYPIDVDASFDHLLALLVAGLDEERDRRQDPSRSAITPPTPPT